MRRMLRVHVECMRQRARNEARPTLLLARSWVSSGKLQSMLLRQQSASPRLCVCFLFGRRSLHLREYRCLIHVCAARRGRHLQAPCPSDWSRSASQRGVQGTPGKRAFRLHCCVMPRVGCISLVWQCRACWCWSRAFGCGFGCINTDALFLHHRRGRVELGPGVLRCRVARGRRWKFQSACFACCVECVVWRSSACGRLTASRGRYGKR